MPISHPSYYATYLAKRIGPFSTLGLAEDTWALNEGVTDDGTFLQQTYDIDREREAMFFAALDRLRRGIAGLRVRRHRSHPAHVLALHRARDIRRRAAASTRSTSDAIRELYKHNDALVGRVMEQLARRRRADGDLGSRLQLVPPRRQPEQLAAARGLPGARRRRRRHAPNGCATSTGRETTRLLPRPDRHVPEPQRPRAAGHRRARRRGRTR